MKTRRIIALILLLASFCLFAQEKKEEKSIITVLDFSMNGVSEHEMKALISLLSSALFQTGRYTVIDVSERDRLLKEMEFSASECTEESCQLQMGRMLSAESIVVGNITKVGTRYVLSAKMLETETARTQNTADGIYASLDVMLDDIFNLANKLAKVSSADKTAAAKTAETAKVETKTAEAKNEETKKTEPATDTTTGDTKKTATPVAETSGNYISLTIGAGISLPLGNYRDIFMIGIPSSIDIAYNLKLGFGEVGLLFDTGFIFQSTKSEKEVRFPYNLLMIPLGLGVSYKTPTKPFFFVAKAGGGIIGYFWLYHDKYPNMENGFNLDPYSTVALGAGYQITPNIEAGLTANASFIFFKANPDLNIGGQAFFGLRF